MRLILKGLLFLFSAVSFVFGNETAARNEGEFIKNFSKMIVSNGGRIKPMQSVALNYLLAFSGRSAYNGKSAEVWLARVLFDPDGTRDDKVFRIDNKDLLYSLNMKKDPSNRYSFNQLQKYGKDIERFYSQVAAKPKENQNAFDNAVLKTYANLVDYFYLTSAFSFTKGNNFLRIEDKSLKQKLKLDVGRNSFSYIELRDKKEILSELEKTPSKEAKPVVSAYEMMSKAYEEYPLHVLPVKMHGQEEISWISPWQAFSVSPYKQSSLEDEIKRLSDAAYFYKEGDFESFDRQIAEFNQFVKESLRANARDGISKKVDAEFIYNEIDAFFWAKVFFFLAFLSICLFSLKEISFFRFFSIFSSAIGVVLIFSGLCMRIYITGRAPVTNLYETFVFVALGTSLLSIVIEFYRKNSIGAFTSAICGFVFLMFSDGFVKGDTMPVLAAVLRSNFWLTTHVVTITIGYMGMIVAGVIAHFYIFNAMRYPFGSLKLKGIASMVRGTLAFSFIFSAMGTILGGIWADQSWGRFWGWDPKENGALLIVLWTLILFHAKAGRIIKDLGFSIGAAFGIVVTALAWIGVNFLSVGLHSYGFTESASKALVVYVGMQIAFLYLAFIVVVKRQKKLEKQP